ncbi:MAG: hypothetical protein JWO22_2186 [Frankiales bacterium]|nr:hypothetical protein [Frankiales bacterium]
MTAPSPEDRLAALLREEADTLRPAGDGLATIRKRVAARRRSRWVLPGALVATAAATSLVFVLSDNGGQSALQQTPGTPAPSVTEPSPSTEPSVTPSTAGGGLNHAFENPAIWPFTSAQEIADWKTTYPYAGDKTALVQHYLKDVLSLDGTFTLTKPCESCDLVDISLAGRKVGQAALERFFLDGDPVYTISTIGETDLKVAAPTDGEAISSPTRVSGRLTGVDENVRITLVDSQGGQLGTTTAPAGTAVPWEGSVSWTATGWVHGAVVLTTFSAKDGTLNRLTVLPVTRDTTARTSGPTFAGIAGHRIDLFDATSGAFVKHLTYPQGAQDDVDLSFADGSLLWLRTHGRCDDAIDRLDGGRASTVATSGGRHVLLEPRSSDTGRYVAYARRACPGSSELPAVVISGLGATRVLTSSQDGPWDLLSVSDSGAALLTYSDGLYLLPAGATDLAQAQELARSSSARDRNGRPVCGLYPAAFDGDSVVTAEVCRPGDLHLVFFDGSGRRVSDGPPVPLDTPSRISVRDGALLVSGYPAGGRPAFTVLRFTGGRFTTVPTHGLARTADW